MAKPHPSRSKTRPKGRPIVEALEARTLLSASPISGPSRQVAVAVHLDRPKAHRIPAAEVASLAARKAPAVAAKAGPKRLVLDATARDGTTVVLRSSKPLGAIAHRASGFKIPGLKIVAAWRGPERNSVILTTSPQANAVYTIRVMTGTAAGIRAVAFAGAGPRVVASAPTVVTPTVPSHSPGQAAPIVTPTAPGQAAPIVAPAAPPAAPATIDPIAPASTDAPRMVSAVSTNNRTVVVQFSEKMSDSALNAANYSIVQKNVNSEAGSLKIIGTPAFLTRSGVVDRSSVVLATMSQNELTYTVTAANVLDTSGTPLQPRSTTSGVVIDPTSASFAGTPPAGTSLTDSDGDGLTDNEEQRGYLVTIKLINGTVAARGVTSDPLKADTDDDGLNDYNESQLRLDPRSGDTDSDTLTDYQEFNEIFSDPLNQDSDGDTLDDGSEFGFFHTSPVFTDTDGDQTSDGDEITGNRNPRVADLPKLAIAVGAVNLGLDVRFTATSSKGSRVLETKSVSSSISEDTSHEHSYQSEVSAGFNVGAHIGTEVDEGKAKFVWGVDVGVNSQWTNTTNDTDRTEATAAYDKSLSTDKEATSDETTERDVVGAKIQTTVNLQGGDRLAYRVKNLQITAFISDPQNPSNLTPIATLLPDAEPADGYTLGPLYPERGPIIVSSTTVFPSLVEDLLKNPRGLVFKISNYDVIDESGRNFGFSSQEVAERTGAVVIDYGGADAGQGNNPAIPESYRVGTTTGRLAVDTDGDGQIDGSDRPVVYDGQGKQVGITLRDALGAVGLTHYTAVIGTSGTPTSYTDDAGVVKASLTAQEQGVSYVTAVNTGVTRVYSVRGVAENGTTQKFWRLLDGRSLIIPDVNLDTMVIKPDANFALSLVQDLDADLIPANIEYRMGTSDQLRDTDGDGLDDRFEAYVGWDVDLGAQGTRHVYSSPTSVDSDRDGIFDGEEAPSLLYDLSGNRITQTWLAFNGSNYSPRTDPVIFRADTNGDGKADTATVEFGTSTFGYRVNLPYDPATAPLIGSARRGVAFTGMPSNLPAETLITDPLNRDTDGDGLDDKTEVDGFQETLRGASGPVLIRTNPTLADTDGDTAPDGLEKQYGGDPTNPVDRDNFADDDQDGLLNIVEKEGWQVTIHEVSTVPYQQGATWQLWVKSDSENADSDGDGLKDGEEFSLHTVPGFYVDVLYQEGSIQNRGVEWRTDPYCDGTNNPPQSHNNYDPVRQVALSDEPVRVIGLSDVGAVASLPVAVASPTDTDLDGLTDFQEVRGFTLRDLGIITLDPTDADTDDDMRTDGDEAELTFDPAKAWIVSPSGEASYRVYSDPHVADADFDGLVDGQEWNVTGGLVNVTRADPTKADTDGDGRDDGLEVAAGTKVNVKDHQITVAFQMVHITADGDPGVNPGDFEMGFGVRKPVAASISFDGLDPARTYAFQDGYKNIDSRVPINPGDDFYLSSWLKHGDYTSGEAVSFGMTETDRFAIEGYLDEHDVDSTKEVQLGGFRGTSMKDDAGNERSSILSWDDIKAKSMHRYTFDFDSSYGTDGENDVDSEHIKGWLVLYVFIN